jgi:T-lymphoma invasion and metastasis-inducing protein 1
LHTHEVVEVCAKILYQVELQRSTLEQMWGFSVEAELIENADRQDELYCYVSRVEDKSVALQNGKEKSPFNHIKFSLALNNFFPLPLS